MRVATFQKGLVLDDPRTSSAIAAEDVFWAAAEGVDLAVFPEAYLDGHSYDRETIAARARPLDDPEVRNLAESLRTFPVTVVVGMFERREKSIRNVALVLRAGTLVGVYAKAHPNEPGIEPGTDMPVFEAGGSRFAVNICWVVSADVAGTCGGEVSFGCAAIVSPAGEIRARVPEGATGRILLDLSVLQLRFHEHDHGSKAALFAIYDP